ncbi:MAG TPA: hotdog domain-containing protein [Candidatus Acidoferrales bacterium]|nr:hotdog domain-containing protein [Candidatus Acidoferrales bacterium]
MKGRRRKAKTQKRQRSRNRQHKTQQNHPLPMGLTARVERVVPFEWTIAAYDSRLPAVFSTPSMIGMMEVAAAQAIAPHLPEGTISVGTRIEVDHLMAVPQGALVEAQARLAGSRGRFLVFDTEARAGETLIGRGRVFRAIVTLEPFQVKASARR